MGSLKKGLLIVGFLVTALAAQAQLRIDRYMITGRNQLAQGHHSEALQTFSRIIRTQDDNWEAWYYRGLTKFYLGDERGSEVDFNKAISLQPNLPELYLYRGIVRDYKGQHYKALEDFNKGISMKPDDPIFRYSRGTTYLRLNNFSRSIEDFDKAIEKNPRMANAYLNRGIAKAKLLKREEAFTDFNEAILLDPFSGEGQQRKGLLYYEIGNYEEALVSFSEAIHKDTTNTQSLYARALSWYEADRKDSCLTDLNRVIKLEPLHAVAWYNRALIRAELNDFDGAINDYHQVNKLHPNHVLTYFNRGILWHQKGDHNGALADLSEAIKLYPDFAKAYMARSTVYKAIGKDDEAQKDLLTAQEKVMANQGRSEDELSLNYADTTIHFEELISLNSQFLRSFSTLAGRLEGSRQFDPIGFMRINENGEIQKDGGDLIESYRQLIISMNYPDFDPDKLKELPVIKKSLEMAGNKRYNDAIDLLSEKIDSNEFKGPALFLRAHLKFEMIQFVMNTGVLNEVVPISLGNVQAYGSNDFSNEVDYTDVNADYTELLDICPELAIVWFNKGLVMLFSQDFVQAEKDFSKAVELDPQFAEAWYNRGIIRLYADEKKIKTIGLKSDACLDLSMAGELGLGKAYVVINEMCGNN